MALASIMGTSCFQIEPIDVKPPRTDSPVVVQAFTDEGVELVQPSTTVVFELNLHETPNPVFKVNEIFDANGFGEPRIYGRWWIDHAPDATGADAIFVLERQDEAQHDGEDDRDICPGGGCWWESQFPVPEAEWRRSGLNQCHQVLAVFSDSNWEECPGMQCTEQPTVLARVVWWVWVYDVDPELEDPPPAPSVDSCVR